MPSRRCPSAVVVLAHLYGSDDLAVARHLPPGRLRAGTATLKFYEARDILVDTAGIACKPITLGSRLISYKFRLHMIDEVPVSTLVRVRHIV